MRNKAIDKKALCDAAARVMDDWSDSLKRQEEKPVSFSESFHEKMEQLLTARKESSGRGQARFRVAKAAGIILLLTIVFAFGYHFLAGSDGLLSDLTPPAFVPGYVPSGWKLVQEQKEGRSRSLTYIGEKQEGGFTIRCVRVTAKDAQTDLSGDQREYSRISADGISVDCYIPADPVGEKDYFWIDETAGLSWQLRSVLPHEENIKIIRGLLSPP